MVDPHIKVLPDPKAVAVEAAERIIAAANEAVTHEGSFSIALSGGSTPKILYELLATPAYSSRMPWADTEIFFGDERCVPPDHKDSNYRMAREALLSKVPIPPISVHRMKGEIDPAAAADEYEQLLRDRFGNGGGGAGAGGGTGAGMDVVLLGMGDDGHTASIFPGTVATRETKRSVLGYFAENSSTGKSWRVTLTAPFINRSRQVMFLICGASKAQRLTEVLEGPRDPERLPSQLIDPAEGELVILLDTPAAGMDAE
jgi:6-phosphogluconolactonase